MEITKEYLQDQIVGMTRELSALLDQVGLVKGAINACAMLIEHLEAPEPELPPEPLVARFEGADVEGLAKGRAMTGEND